MTVDMEDLRHTGSSIIGFTILDVKNYELAKTSGEMSQVITISVYICSKKKKDLYQKRFEVERNFIVLCGLTIWTKLIKFIRFLFYFERYILVHKCM